MSELLNSKQVASAIGVSPQTVGAWVAEGAITPEIREGRVIRFDLSKVRAQLAKRATTTTRRQKVATL